MTDVNWRLRGACRDEDPDLFYPSEHGGRIAESRYAAARKVCQSCTVQLKCLEDALSVPEAHDHGVRAGLTPSQRVRIRRCRNGACAHPGHQR